MLLLWLIACAPHLRFPGPLGGLGDEPVVERFEVDAPEEGAPPRIRPTRARPVATDGEAIARAAASFLGAKKLLVDGAVYRWDCSGFVEASLAAAGLAFRGSSAMLFDQAKELGVLHRRRKPHPGDVAFFDDTYDRNGNGRVDDPLSHVAVVERVDADGTVHMVHVGSRGVAPLTMNLRRPEDRADDDGKPLNDPLRARSPKDGPRTRTLTGELWVAFASFWKARGAVADEAT